MCFDAGGGRRRASVGVGKRAVGEASGCGERQRRRRGSDDEEGIRPRPRRLLVRSPRHGHGRRSAEKSGYSLASQEVTVQLMIIKCLLVLYYAIEACPLNKSQIKALDYVLFS